MENPSIPKTYLLGEMQGSVACLASGKVTPIAEFMTINFVGGEAVALFASRLDAEICRQHLNLQSLNGRMNHYEVIANTDPRVEILKSAGNPSARLVVGFVMDQGTRKLVVQGGLYSLMHFNLYPADQDWLLNSGGKPVIPFIWLVHWEFSRLGALAYLDELVELESLDKKSLAGLANTAVLQAGILPTGNPTIPAVFSPRRQCWVELKLGDDYGAR